MTEAKWRWLVRGLLLTPLLLLAAVGHFGDVFSPLLVFLALLFALSVRGMGIVSGVSRLKSVRPEIAVALVAAVAILGLAHPPLSVYRSLRPEGPLSLRNILYRNAHNDFRIDLAADELHVVCLSGLGLACLPYDELRGYVGYDHIPAFGYQVVLGTSDHIAMPMQEWLTSRAWDYGNVYNRELMAYAKGLDRETDERPDTWQSPVGGSGYARLLGRGPFGKSPPLSSCEDELNAANRVHCLDRMGSAESNPFNNNSRQYTILRWSHTSALPDID